MIKNLQQRTITITTIEKNDSYQGIIDTHPHKNIIIIAENNQYKDVWNQYYGKQNANPSHDIIPLPNYTISNDLDRRVLAALHQTISDIESHIDNYSLDSAAKEIVKFIDKLTNRYIRRSRRRFWASGMNTDKLSAYNTLYTVLKNTLLLTASFAPFISEHIRQQLQTFSKKNTQKKDRHISIHLDYLPVVSEQYINTQLLEEIELIRRIVSL